MTAPTESGPARRISRLSPDPRRPGAVRVECGGHPLLTVPAEVATAFGLEAGQDLDEARFGALCRAADEEAALRTGLRCLERRAFAARDLARRLVLKGHPPRAADRALARLAALGLVDDERFARGYVQTRFARGRGPGRLRRELTALGVAPALVDRVLAAELSEEATRDQTVALARKRAGQLGDLPRQARLRRVLAYLARRGHRGPQAVEAAREAVSGGA